MEKPTEETVQDLLDWLDSLWALEVETEQELPGGDWIIPRPFTWATDDRSTRLHSLEYMLYTLSIDTVSMDFKCKHCVDVERIGYNLAQKYTQILLDISRKGLTIGGVAPNSWLFPTRPLCKNCNNKRRSLGQVITEKESSMFLLMGKLIGCCKVQQLRDFYKQNQIECNGKKPRLVYLTYLGLCKQLDQRGNYDL